MPASRCCGTSRTGWHSRPILVTPRLPAPALLLYSCALLHRAHQWTLAAIGARVVAWAARHPEQTVVPISEVGGVSVFSSYLGRTETAVFRLGCEVATRPGNLLSSSQNPGERRPRRPLSFDPCLSACPSTCPYTRPIMLSIRESDDVCWMCSSPGR